MLTPRPTNENGDPLYQWRDGRWVTRKKLRQLALIEYRHLLEVPTVASDGVEDLGRTVLPIEIDDAEEDE